jgi:hypothetical protein
MKELTKIMWAVCGKYGGVKSIHPHQWQADFEAHGLGRPDRQVIRMLVTYKPYEETSGRPATNERASAQDAD